MAAPEFVLVWALITFGGLVLASYIGTTLALRSFFDDEHTRITDIIRLGDTGQE